MNNPTWNLSFGTDCKNNSSPLQLMTIADVYEMICRGDRDLVAFTKNLRAVLRYSKERYRAMKTSLPFFSCSVFDPPYRGVRNFLSACGLIIDIDYQDVLPADLLQKCKADPRVIMGYVSPSNAGLKLLFAFDKVIVSAEQYTALYRYFSHDFASQYHITDHIDLKNCDVSRISFICHDPQAWYNPDAIALDTDMMSGHYVADPLMSDKEPPKPGDLAPSVYRQILLKLDTRPRTTAEVRPIHPDVSAILPAIADELAGYGIIIKETVSIQYGAKIQLYKDKDQGELNIYHGKQGYSVVSSPRKGTHPELNEVARHIIEGVLVRF